MSRVDRDIHREQPALLRDCRRPRAKGEIVARLTACPSCYGVLEWSPLKRLSELRPPISAVAGSSADTEWLWLQADLMTGFNDSPEEPEQLVSGRCCTSAVIILDTVRC